MIFLRAFVVLAIILFGAGAAIARVSSLTGSISILQEYDSNIHLVKDNEEDGWFTVISPSLVYTSQAEQSSLSFGYAPGLRYDHNDNSTEVDHYLTLEGDRRFSPRLSGRFRENFIRSNDYTYFVLEHVQQEGAGVLLSGERVRREYWVNSIAVSGNYEYARDSGLGFGYSNRILKNDTSGLDDYVKHQPFVSISYRLNRHWETSLSYDYIRGDFDTTEDIEQHLAGVTINYHVSPHQMFSGAYRFTGSHYEGPENDYQLHRGDLGWQRNLNRHSTVTALVGASYADREVGSNETAFNYAVNLTREIKRGQLSLGGQGGMDEHQFSAIDDDDDGLSRFWSLRGAVDYQLWQNLSSNTYLSYREDNFFRPDQDVKDRSLLGGLKLSYSFQRWNVLSLGYSYRRLDTDRDVNDYQDHRAYVEFSVGKELARWL
jgi:hypothetical protein